MVSLVPSSTSSRHFIPGENKMAAGSGAGNETMAWLVEQVILRLGYGMNEGLSPAEATHWHFFPYPPPPPPPPTKAESQKNQL